MFNDGSISQRRNKIKPRIIDDEYNLQPIINAWKKEFIALQQNDEEKNLSKPFFEENIESTYKLEKLYRNKENIKFVLDAMYGATNEPMGTSYRSRLVKKGYIYAGKN